MAIKDPLLPRSPKKETNIKELQRWAEADAKAMKYMLADLINQINWTVVDTAPTETPTRIPCIKLYQNGATYRLYIYYGGSWKYVALT